MNEVIIVRYEKCEGCLYGKAPLASNAKEGIEEIAKDKGSIFYCHCHYRKRIFSDMNGHKTVCHGFYKANKDRFVDRIVRFSKKKGKFWQMFLKMKSGFGLFIINPTKEQAQ